MRHESACAITAAIALLAPMCGAVAPYGRFEDGLLDKTHPTGWMKRWCETQRAGLTGHPEALGYPYDSCLWAGRIERQGGHGAGWWRYEQTAYYSDGLLRLGYALSDAELIAKGESGVDWTLRNQTEEGQLGDPCLWEKSRYKLCNGFEMWPMAVYFRVMKAAYDARGDGRIPTALARYYKQHAPKFVGKARNVVNAEGILWTYEKTGDRELLALAEKAWSEKGADDPAGTHALSPALCRGDGPIYMHGVSYCEQLKVPLLLGAYTGKREYFDQANSALDRLNRYGLLPDGCPGSAEETRGNCVHWGHETCDVADYTWSLGYFLEMTGDGRHADAIERCVFNAGFGCTDKSFRSLQYYSNVNQFICTCDSDHNPYFVGKSRMQYRPVHDTECCAGNVTRIFPNYISRMWLRDRAGDPVAALYGPCRVQLAWAEIEEETEYPVGGRIDFRFKVRESGCHGFSFRVPGWCGNGARASVNGEDAGLRLAPGTFVTLRRTFNDGDVVSVDFPMTVVYEDVPRRIYVVKDKVSNWVGALKGKEGPQGTVVRRGPLVFSHAIPASRSEDAEEHAQMGGRKSGNPAFKSWNLRPAGHCGYALAGTAADARVRRNGEGSFTDGEKPVIAVDVPVRRIRWGLTEDRFTEDMPEMLEPACDANETLTLVPYAATQLRLTVFPRW